jgi:hypothetical protein
MARKKKLVNVMLETLSKINPNTLSVKTKLQILTLFALGIGVFAYFVQNGKVKFQADTMPNQAPVVSISFPQNNAIITGNEVTVSASAFDDRRVAKMELYVDGLSTFTTYSSNFSYSVSQLSKNKHIITVKAFDDSNSAGYQTIDINIQ